MSLSLDHSMVCPIPPTVWNLTWSLESLSRVNKDQTDFKHCPIETAAPFLQPPPSRRQGCWHRKTCSSRSARFPHVLLCHLRVAPLPDSLVLRRGRHCSVQSQAAVATHARVGRLRDGWHVTLLALRVSTSRCPRLNARSGRARPEPHFHLLQVRHRTGADPRLALSARGLGACRFPLAAARRPPHERRKVVLHPLFFKATTRATARKLHLTPMSA